MEVEETGNTKIAGVRVAEAEKKKKDKRHHRGQLLPQTEAVMYILSMNEISTDLKFIHVTTTPLEQRPAFDRNLPLNKLKEQGVISNNQQYSMTSDLDSNIIFSHAVRSRHYPNL